jgi:hypothetical protein
MQMRLRGKMKIRIADNKSKEELEYEKEYNDWLVKKYEEEQWGREVMESDWSDKKVEIDMQNKRGSVNKRLRRLAEDEVDFTKTYKPEYLDGNDKPMNLVIFEDILGSMEEVSVKDDEEHFESDGETERDYDAYTLYQYEVIFEAPFTCVGIKNGEEDFFDLDDYPMNRDQLMEDFVEDYGDLRGRDDVEVSYSFNIDHKKKVFRLEVEYSYTETDEEARWNNAPDKYGE